MKEETRSILLLPLFPLAGSLLGRSTGRLLGMQDLTFWGTFTWTDVFELIGLVVGALIAGVILLRRRQK